ncbi:uncharacterized protein Z520_08113 [Fonsecaea multimorphosa CBS 102226]|uniref:Uncharacterized protein n=1 Tax=Fonsecaea multimorphosa CBS 102226 TaxID=1442371 RepID=A0A0D2H3C7_9EURO|nr:uncharacterized protein Z520_08113 [Fonsecaea multimorphosa CBS 102226]KIX96335.1 hypothetical protein Z520_08113 [Fonsecaea multimorphosa CBS 102226]OAL21994.1 hypothetical protein AYO22_07591 [Fonsecaea multimorphosa]
MPSPNHKAKGSGSLSVPITGAALRRGDLKISDPIPFDESGAFSGASTVPHARHPSGQRQYDTTWPRASTATQDTHVRHVSDVPPHPRARTSAGPSLIPSSMSSIPSKASLHQKKPSGLRATLKRMFSSKKHRSVPTDTSGFHYGDSGHLKPVTEQPVRTRLDSAPPFGAETTLRGAALTSHSTTYPQFEAVHQSLPPPPRRGRRNTLPSLVFSDIQSSLVPAIVDWPAPQSASVEQRAKEDCVSDGQFKRRSRSADALNELLHQGAAQRPSTRDRAGEIAYWRNSAIQNPVPVYSGQSISVDPTHVLGPDSAVAVSEHDRSTVDPMQTFDFGLGSPGRDEIGLEQRVNTLEIKLFDFEFALAKLQGNDLPNPRLNPRPFSRGSVRDIFQQNRTSLTLASSSSNDLSHYSSGGVQDFTFLSSPGESPMPSPEIDDVFNPQRASKATTATIRPLTARRRSPRRSRGTSPSSIHIPADKFEALLEMMKEEKAARQKLEEQVHELQKEMNSLRTSTPIYATIREPYPTPSPESNQNLTGTPPRMKTLHRTHPFHLDHPLPQEISRFSGTEDSDVEEGFEDVYETPREEQRDTFETARDTQQVAVI